MSPEILLKISTWVSLIVTSNYSSKYNYTEHNSKHFKLFRNWTNCKLHIVIKSLWLGNDTATPCCNCGWCATDFWRYGTRTNERRWCRNGLQRNVHRLRRLLHMRITRWRCTIILSDIIRMIWYIGMRNERTIISSVLDMSAVSTQESTRCLHDVRSGIIVGGFHDTRIWPIFLFVRFYSYAITNT